MPRADVRWGHRTRCRGCPSAPRAQPRRGGRVSHLGVPPCVDSTTTPVGRGGLGVADRVPVGADVGGGELRACLGRRPQSLEQATAEPADCKADYLCDPESLPPTARLRRGGVCSLTLPSGCTLGALPDSCHEDQPALSSTTSTLSVLGLGAVPPPSITPTGVPPGRLEDRLQAAST